MKPVIIIAIAFVLLIPLPILAQESLTCPSGAYHGLDNAGNDACRDIKTNKVVSSLSKPIPESQIKSPSTSSNIITFGDESTLLILLVGLVTIGIIGVSAFKIIEKRNVSSQKRKENERIKQKEEARIIQERQKKLKEKERLEKIHEEERKRMEIEDREGEKARQRVKEERDRKQKEEEEINRELKEKEAKEELKLQEKLKNKENLYDPALIESLQETATIRIFYDLQKKETKYWKDTDHLNRIHFKDDEIKEELKIKQNKITLRISVEAGGKHKFAKLISGGNMEFWDHDVGGYNLQIHFSKPEEFPKAIMMKHIRHSFSKVQIHDGTYSISAILVREDANYQDASNVLKRVAKAFCDEMLETGDILVEI